MRFVLLGRWCFILLVPTSVSGQALTASPASGATPTTSFFSPTDKSFATGPHLQWPLPFNGQQHTFMFSPKWQVWNHNRFSMNVWALGGVAKRFALMDPFVLPVDATPPLVRDLSSPFSQKRFMGPNGVAISLGSSLSFRITDRIVYEIAKPEYLIEKGRTRPTL